MAPPANRRHRCSLSTPLIIVMVTVAALIAVMKSDKVIFGNKVQQDDPVDDGMSVDDDEIVLVNGKVKGLIIDNNKGTGDTSVLAHATSKKGHKITTNYRDSGLLVKKISKSDEAFIPSYPVTKAPTPAIHNRTIYFLHILKSGGSSMCQLAKRNHMTANYRRNCNVQPDEHCCGGKDTVVAQQSFAANTTFSYVSVSAHPMYQSMDTDSYYYAVMLRESQMRYRSHYQHVKIVHEQQDEEVINFESWYKHQPDNWNVRTICGPDCAETPKYKITKEQWESTLDRIAKFESILFLETFEDSFDTFCDKVGWPYTKVTARDHHKIGAYDKTVKEKWEPLMSALDDALLIYAKHLMAKKTDSMDDTYSKQWKQAQETVDNYLENGPSRKCRNRCCGECSQHK